MRDPTTTERARRAARATMASKLLTPGEMAQASGASRLGLTMLHAGYKSKLPPRRRRRRTIDVPKRLFV